MRRTTAPSHAGSGHTDTATINARKPLTDGMRIMLERLVHYSNAGSLNHYKMSTPAKNQCRGLAARGYIEIRGDYAIITLAGREAIK